MTDGTDARQRLLEAALMSVPFDGWSEATLKAAAQDADMPLEEARVLFPRGGVDLALGYHEMGDAEMKRRFRAADTIGMRYSEKVSFAIRLRLQISDPEAVRRGTVLLSMPPYAAEGAAALWGTADAIWEVLGDTSEDVNWYTKRATLSAVFSATVLYWLGDETENHVATWDFLNRRIDQVMKFEKLKSRVNRTPLGKLWQKGPGALLSGVKAPVEMRDLPGSLHS